MIARRLLLTTLIAVTTAGCGSAGTPSSALAPTAGSLAAFADTKAGVTPAMVAGLTKLLDVNGDGAITKNEGYVELIGPEKTDRTLISNYYDEKWQHGAHVKPLAVKTIADSLAKGFTFSLKAVKGETPNHGHVGMTAKEIDRLSSGLADILKQSPLFKKGLLGGSLPVNHVVIPHFLFRKPKNAVEMWSMRKVESAIDKRLSDLSNSITINPEGKHAQGAFVLLIQDHPAVD